MSPTIRTEPQAGRNDPCPCGSGKKNKRCCLPVQEAAEAAKRRPVKREPGPARKRTPMNPQTMAVLGLIASTGYFDYEPPRARPQPVRRGRSR